jgi:hypothetical protein
MRLGKINLGGHTVATKLTTPLHLPDLPSGNHARRFTGYVLHKMNKRRKTVFNLKQEYKMIRIYSFSFRLDYLSNFQGHLSSILLLLAIANLPSGLIQVLSATRLHTS